MNCTKSMCSSCYESVLTYFTPKPYPDREFVAEDSRLPKHPGVHGEGEAAPEADLSKIRAMADDDEIDVRGRASLVLIVLEIINTAVIGLFSVMMVKVLEQYPVSVVTYGILIVVTILVAIAANIYIIGMYSDVLRSRKSSRCGLFFVTLAILTSPLVFLNCYSIAVPFTTTLIGLGYGVAVGLVVGLCHVYTRFNTWCILMFTPFLAVALLFMMSLPDPEPEVSAGIDATDQYNHVNEIDHDQHVEPKIPFRPIEHCMLEIALVTYVFAIKTLILMCPPGLYGVFPKVISPGQEYTVRP